jgi:signal transduction histidine kinase
MMLESSSLDRLPKLIEAAAAVVEETDLEKVLRRLVSEARSATGARYAALGVIGEHGALTDFLHEGLSSEEVGRIGALPAGRGVLGTVIRLNRTIRIESVSDHPDAYGFPEHHPHMETFLGVPVSVGDRAFGNLYLTEKEGGFTDQDVVIVEALSRIAGGAVHTARLQDRLRRLAVVEDRQRIARELHDSVIQNLFAVGLGLQGLSERIHDAMTSATLNDAVDRLDDSVESLRNYIFQLKESSRSRAALDERLQELVSRMGSAYPSIVRLEMGLVGTDDEYLDDEIVKIVTEALSNALRHSSSRNVEVSITSLGQDCLIRVIDDGVGFDVASAAPGMGLANIRTRAQRAGGSATISSSPGKGTTVEITLPIS